MSRQLQQSHLSGGSQIRKDQSLEQILSSLQTLLSQLNPKELSPPLRAQLLKLLNNDPAISLMKFLVLSDRSLTRQSPRSQSEQPPEALE